MPFERASPRPPATWTVDVGAGVIYNNRAASGRDSRVSAVPWLSFDYKDRLYANPMDGLGYNIVKSDRFRAGVQVAPQFSAGSPEGADLDRPGFGADAGGYAYYRLPGNLVIGGQVLRDIASQSEGMTYRATLAQQSATPIGLLTTSVYARGANAKWNRAYYGVTPADSAQSGLAAYKPGGGIDGVGAAAFLLAPVGNGFGAGGFAGYERLVGEAADSPVIRSRNVFRVGVLVAKRFEWN